MLGVANNKKYLLVIILFIAGVILYYNVINFEFIFYDDPTYINNIFHNSKNIWASIVWSFTEIVNANWSPLTVISLVLDFKIYGLNAGGYHFTNVILHNLNAILVFLFLCRLFKNIKLSFFIALLFLIHPINVEAVSWISERKGLLASFFTLLSLIYFYKYIDTYNKYFYSLSLVFFLLGLMSKAVFVILPLIFLLINWYEHDFKRVKYSVKKEILIVSPFLFIAFIFGLFTIYIHSISGAIISGDLIPFSARIFNAINSYVIYLKQIFYPFNLSINYEYKLIPVSTVIVNLIIILFIYITAYKLRVKYKFILFGLLWFTIFLLPVLGLIQSGLNAHADRYLYLPGIGIYIIIVLFLNELIKLEYVRPTIVKILICLFYSVLLFITFVQYGNWRSSVHIFEHAYTIDDSNYVVNFNLANIYILQGEYKKGFKYYEQARIIAPTYYLMYFVISDNLILLKKYDLAIMILNDLLKIEKDNFSAKFKIAKIRAYKGEYNTVIEILEKINPVNDDSSDIAYLLAYSYFKKKNNKKAINILNENKAGLDTIQSNKYKKLINEINSTVK